jgi:type IV secretory pathway VirB9-like protein
MRSAFPALMMLASTAMTGCVAFKPPQISYDDERPAVLEGEPPKPVQVVELPKPLPLPGQLKPLPGVRSKPEPRDPRQRVDLANAAARIQPVRSGYLNAMQVYPFVDGALYQVYSAPGQVTDIALQEGEQLVGSGPVAAGDTVRWIIGDTESGTAAAKKVHILVKPTRPDVTTNLDAATPVETNLDINSLRFRYAIEGDNPPWRPLHAFDDGKKVYIEFPRGIAQGEMPPLFVVGAEGKTSDLVNYRVRANHMIVDRLFAAAELRLGDRGSERRVRIVRTDGRPGW